MQRRPKEPNARRLLADNLRRLRLEREMSQEDLAKAAGVSQQCVSETELAKRNVSIDTMARMSRALEVPVSELFQQA